MDVKTDPSDGFLIHKHPNLLRFMESQFVYPPFLALNDQKLRKKYEFRSTVQLTAQILWTARYFYFLSTAEDDLINYYLADANYMLGPARNPINLLYGLMNLCSIVSVVFTKFSTILQSETHIYWLKACEVFETGYFREIGEFKRELQILSFLKYFLLSVDSAVTVSSDINFFIQTPVKYLFWGISFAVYHVFDAVIVTFYLVNRQPIYVFHFYLYAKYFVHLSNCIDRKSIFNATVIERYLDSHRDLIGLYKFYRQSNCLIFILVAIMQVILCYYIFFSNIDLSAKMALMLILFAAHVCGMCGFFLIGTYLRDKHDQLIRKLFTMAVKSGPLDKKICLLNVLEHSFDKTDLQILGNICTTSEYFLLVLLETGSTLLLLIANTNR